MNHSHICTTLIARCYINSIQTESDIYGDIGDNYLYLLIYIWNPLQDCESKMQIT